MKSLFNRPATLGALALCVLLTATLASRCIDGLNQSAAISLKSESALQILPEDAMVVGKVDVKNLREDSQEFASMFPLEEAMADMSAEMSARLEQFAEETGFNPMEDVSSMYYAVSADESETGPAMVIYADISSDRMERFVDENLSDGFRTYSYDGLTIYEVDDSKGLAFSFVNDEMIVVAHDAATIEGMVDRASSGSETLKGSVADMANRVAGNDFWMVITGIQQRVDMDDADDVDPRVLLAGQAIDDIAVGVDVSADDAVFQSHLGPASNISSDDLESIVKGAIAAVRTSSMNEKPIIAEMLDRVKVDERDGMVRVSMQVTSDDLQDLKNLATNGH